MTPRQNLHVVKPSTSVDDGNYADHGNDLSTYLFTNQVSKFVLGYLPWFITALELLVEKKVTGLPVINDDWTLVHIISFVIAFLCLDS